WSANSGGLPAATRELPRLECLCPPKAPFPGGPSAWSRRRRRSSRTRTCTPRRARRCRRSSGPPPALAGASPHRAQPAGFRAANALRPSGLQRQTPCPSGTPVARSSLVTLAAHRRLSQDSEHTITAARRRVAEAAERSQIDEAGLPEEA